MELRLSQPGWPGVVVELAANTRNRWRGLRPVPGTAGLMLWSRSIHTLGMAVPLMIVEADSAGVVVSTRLVPPGRLVWRRRPRWFIELAAATAPPRPGTGLAAAPILGRWPAA